MKNANRTYTSWRQMRQRCQNPSNKDYPRYGGAGVTVHARWESFEDFIADMGERPPATTLDRIDGTRGYEPGNCRWASITEQNRNRKTTTMLTYQGETLCLAEWAQRRGVSIQKLWYRFSRGLPVEDVLATGDRRKCGKSGSCSAHSTDSASSDAYR